MRLYWNKLINLGIIESLNVSEIARIRLLNKLAIITFFAASILQCIRILTQSNTVTTSSFAIAIVLAVLYLNYKLYYKTARVLSCFLFPFAVALITISEGAALGEFIIYLVLIVLAFVLLDYNKLIRNLCVAWVHFLSFASYIYITYSFDVNPIATNKIGTIMLFAACVLVMCYLIIFYQEELLHERKIQDTLLNKLQKKNLELERFAFISSHDLKVPLKNIINFSELSIDSLNNLNTEEATEYIDIINKNASRMNNLIEDTLELISYDNKHSLDVEIDLNNTIEQIISLLLNTIYEKNVSIRKLKPLPKIKGVKSEILSCFKNLIENAIKYNNSSSVRIILDFVEVGSDYIISVKDNGIGIDEKQYGKIFEMYQRLVRQDQYQGTGLGLPICKKIIEKNKGEIWVESAVGEGSTFFIRLPKIVEEVKMIPATATF